MAERPRPSHPHATPLPRPLTRAGKAAAMAVRKFVRDATRDLDRETVARIFLKGSGLEIGALHEPLKVSDKATVRYVDRLSTADLREHYPELKDLDLVEVDVVDNGETLLSVADQTQDFLIANQVLEHCEDPISTLKHWFRVLKPGGVLFLSLPDKRYTFDEQRPSTTVEHVLRDFHEGPEGSREEHFREWAQYVDKVPEAEIAERAKYLQEIDYSIHFHAWTLSDMVELVQAARQVIPELEIELLLRTDYLSEVLLILKKQAA